MWSPFEKTSIRYLFKEITAEIIITLHAHLSPTCCVFLIVSVSPPQEQHSRAPPITKVINFLEVLTGLCEDIDTSPNGRSSVTSRHTPHIAL